MGLGEGTGVAGNVLAPDGVHCGEVGEDLEVVEVEGAGFVAAVVGFDNFERGWWGFVFVGLAVVGEDAVRASRGLVGSIVFGHFCEVAPRSEDGDEGLVAHIYCRHA